MKCSTLQWQITREKERKKKKKNHASFITSADLLHFFLQHHSPTPIKVRTIIPTSAIHAMPPGCSKNSTNVWLCGAIVVAVTGGIVVVVSDLGEEKKNKKRALVLCFCFFRGNQPCHPHPHLNTAVQERESNHHYTYPPF